MSYHVIIEQSVVGKIGAIGLPRELLLQLVTKVREELGYNIEAYQHLRIPGDEDRLFAFRINLADTNQFHTLTFVVDDATAPGTLFVLEVAYRSRPIPP
jgi:hypothetical protein